MYLYIYNLYIYIYINDVYAIKMVQKRAVLELNYDSNRRVKHIKQK